MTISLISKKLFHYISADFYQRSDCWKIKIFLTIALLRENSNEYWSYCSHNHSNYTYMYSHTLQIPAGSLHHLAKTHTTTLHHNHLNLLFIQKQQLNTTKQTKVLRHTILPANSSCLHQASSLSTLLMQYWFLFTQLCDTILKLFGRK